MKTCIRCERSQPLSEFYTRPLSDGRLTHRGTCKSCMAEETRLAREANRERYNAYQRTHAAKLGRRARKLRDEYGMTLQQWDLIWASQDFACAICKGQSGDESLHGDHDHATGKFRGILCGLCNRMLGQGQDNPQRLLAGAAYLVERL